MGSIWHFLMAHSELILTVIKDTGYVGSGFGVMYAVVKWLTSFLHTARDTNAKIDLVMANHLPHIQEAVDAQGAALRGIKSDVRDLDTKVSGYGDRLDDTKSAVHALGTAFLQHLEHASKESTPAIEVQPVIKTRRRVRAV